MFVTLARPPVSSSIITNNRQPLFSISITSPVESARLFRFVNLVLSSTVLLVHLILRISLHHSHQLRSHHLSPP